MSVIAEGSLMNARKWTFGPRAKHAPTNCAGIKQSRFYLSYGCMGLVNIHGEIDNYTYLCVFIKPLYQIFKCSPKIIRL